MIRPTKAQRLARREVAITTLPGGARITFEGFLRDTTCPKCGIKKPAGEFLKSWRTNSHGAPELSFTKKDWQGQRVQSCLTCEPPWFPFPKNLRGTRFVADYYDEKGNVIGWRERDSAGMFGPELSLKCLQVRTDNGIVRPQPKFNRIKNAPRPTTQHRQAATDSRRSFNPEERFRACERQNWICTLCDELLTKENAVGDHIKPHADGWITIGENCQAVHDRCNSIKGRRSTAWARERIQTLKAQERWVSFGDLRGNVSGANIHSDDNQQEL